MSKLLSDAVEEAIRTNLNQVVANELKDFISEAEKTKKQLETEKVLSEGLQKDLKVASDLTDSLKVELHKTKEELARMKWREEKFKEAEQTVLLAQKETEKAIAVSDTMKYCFETVFRNGQIKRQILGTENLPYSAGQPGGYTNTGYSPQPTSKTITEEELG